MSDWTDTLAARLAGEREGFLASDLPLEEQDESQGGPRAETAAAPEVPTAEVPVGGGQATPAPGGAPPEVDVSSSSSRRVR